MEKGWVQIFLTGDAVRAEMARELLEIEGINAVVLNQKDTVYQSFGDIAIYVNEADEAVAIETIKNLKD